MVLADKAPQVLNWASMTNDHQATLDIVKSLTEAHAKKGVKIHVHQPIQAKAGSGDFRTQIARCANSGATGVMNLLIGSASLAFYKQANTFGRSQGGIARRCRRRHPR